METRSDPALVAAVVDGDDHAFAALVGRYRDDYTRFAVRVLGSHADADEALQSAFLRAYRRMAACRDPARFGAWIYQIVVNECRAAQSSEATAAPCRHASRAAERTPAREAPPCRPAPRAR